MRRCFTLVRQILHPSTPGGLTYLLLPSKEENALNNRVMDIPTMERHLLNHSRRHFSHAHGTPFTIPPLSDLLGFDGLTPFGNSIFNSDPIPAHLPIAPVTHLLTHQCSLLKGAESSDHLITFDELMKGFKKWPEWTYHLTFWMPSWCIQVPIERLPA